jgi:hypothetical protein
MATQGKYAVVDTTLSITDSTPIPGLNGRQGDNGRIVYFALKDGRLPHNLDGQDVTLEVKDAAGKIKVVNGIYDMISATAGLFSMLIPAEVYQAAGDVEEAFLVVTDQQNLVISSIPITFTVFANGIILSANASQDYINTIQKFIDDFGKQISGVSNNLENVDSAVNSLNLAITNYTNLINDNAVASLNHSNDFTENNTFEKDLIVKGNIHGKADNAGNADIAVAAQHSDTTSMANSLSLPFKYQQDIDFNVLPAGSENKTYSAYYFSSPVSLKNAPATLDMGIVEQFVMTNTSILQKVTRPGGYETPTWTRRITGWNDNSEKVVYGDWVSGNGTHSTSVNLLDGSLVLTRSGNVVMAKMAGPLGTTKFEWFTTLLTAGSIPNGYRPISIAELHLDQSDWQDGRRSGMLRINSDGSLVSRAAYNHNTTDQSTLVVFGTYITNDDMPI